MGIGALFTYLLVAVGAALGWLYPVVGLLVYFALSILRPEQLWFWDFPPTVSNRFSMIVATSTLAGWLFRGLGDWKGLRPIWIPMAGLTLFIAYGALATLGWARYPEPAWVNLTLQFKIWLMVLVAVTLIRDQRQIHAFAWTAAVAIGYLAVVCNEQYYLQGFNRTERFTLHGDNNNMALIMVMGVPLAFFLGIYTRRLWLKGLSFLAVACLIHVVLFSMSRGGMLGLAMVGVMMFTLMMVKMPNKGVTMLIGVMFLALALRLSGERIRNEWGTIFVESEVRDASAQSRPEMWGVAWRVMKDHPEGLGPRNLPLRMPEYGFEEGKLVHSVYFQIGADWGFVGLFGWLCYFFGSLVLSLKMSMSATAQRLGWPVYFGRMISISLTGYLISAAFLSIERVEVSYIIAALGLCTVAYVESHRRAAGDAVAFIPELEQVPSPEAIPALLASRQ